MKNIIQHPEKNVYKISIFFYFSPLFRNFLEIFLTIREKPDIIH